MQRPLSVDRPQPLSGAPIGVHARAVSTKVRVIVGGFISTPRFSVFSPGVYVRQKIVS
jgi:hypothetical protein